MTAYQHTHPDDWAPTAKELRDHLSMAHRYHIAGLHFDQLDETHRLLLHLTTPPTVVVSRAALEAILGAVGRKAILDDGDLDAYRQLRQAVQG